MNNLIDFNSTMLIVDDEPETIKRYADFLAPPGAPISSGSPGERYNLLLAKTGEEAIKLVQSELAQGRRVAAGFFEVKLGVDMDGLATLQAIRALDQDIHCTVVTADQGRCVDEVNEVFGLDFKDQWDYLNKPFTRGEVVQKARQMSAAWNRKRQVEVMTQQLIRSERLAAVGQVARGVGHEFGNILLRIIGKTDLALMEKDAEKIKAHLAVVMTAAERAGGIVRNLQSFSKTVPAFQKAQISSPLDEALSLVNHELVKCSVKLEKKYSPVPPVRADVGGLLQVFLNLFLNATFSMLKGGLLTVTLTEAQGPEVGGMKAGVAIRISSDVLPRIFEFAYTTKGDRGSGLGLSISREIVEAHGGKISVSTEVGIGTEFTVWLPL